ncbi:cobalamin B12-binding domain-containing protein [Methylobacterium sp. 37f]|uniref:cobalamin B12-binding domain-containing protein n=1 Tax=Methylobacterium sp. 37f TaxID=2817058 RepID=UPI001FFC4E62|nr:cobalamin B12-binding domain-containing protein [Methylobacterium sp. 37f]
MQNSYKTDIEKAVRAGIVSLDRKCWDTSPPDAGVSRRIFRNSGIRRARSNRILPRQRHWEGPMDDVRQFGDCLRYEPTGRDVSDLYDAGIGAQLAVFGQAMRLQRDLARVVETEIIPRLMLAHQIEPPLQTSNILPDAVQIAAFTALMLAPAGDDLESRLTELLATGLGPESLLLDLLAPTARHLGTLWEDDLCDFVEVTRAMGRLQRIMREMISRFGGEPTVVRSHRRILLLPCPGDSHRFGLTVVERFFREAGWSVTCTAAEPDDVSLRRIREGWFDIVGLSLACETLFPRMTETVAALRRHSRNAAVRVMVGGPAFATDPESFRCVGADASAGDARHAVSVAECLLDLSPIPC